MGALESQTRRELIKTAEKDGRVVDSMEVRRGLLGRVKSGEITLDQARSELNRIKRSAKKHGMVTRSQAWRGQ